MKIPLSYVKLRDTLDSVEPKNTTGLSSARGWKLTLDTDTDYIQGILTRGEGEGAKVTRVEFHALAAAHWERESWAEPIDFATVHQKLGYDMALDLAPESKPKPTGGKRGRKGPRAGSSEANRVQPEGAGGDDPQS